MRGVGLRPRGSTGNAGEPAAQRHGFQRRSRFRGSFGQRGSGRKSVFAVRAHGDLGGVGLRPRGTTGDTRESAAQRHGLSRDSRFRGSFGQRGSGRKSGFAVCTHGDLCRIHFRPRGPTGNAREPAAQGNVHRGHAS